MAGQVPVLRMFRILRTGDNNQPFVFLVLLENPEHRAVGRGAQRPMPVVSLGLRSTARREHLESISQSVQGHVHEHVRAGIDLHVLAQGWKKISCADADLVLTAGQVVGGVVSVSISKYSYGNGGGGGKNLNDGAHSRS